MDDDFRASLILEGAGFVRVTERSGDELEELVDTIHESELRIDANEGEPDDDTIKVSLWTSHVQNEVTKRTFHSNIEVDLTLSQAKRLRDFLTYLLD